MTVVTGTMLTDVAAYLSDDGRYLMMTDRKTGQGCDVLINSDGFSKPDSFSHIVKAFLDQAEKPCEVDVLLDLVEALVRQECVSDWVEANGRDFGHNCIPVYEQACKALAEARPGRWKLESWGISRRTM